MWMFACTRIIPLAHLLCEWSDAFPVTGYVPIQACLLNVIVEFKFHWEFHHRLATKQLTSWNVLGHANSVVMILKIYHSPKDTDRLECTETCKFNSRDSENISFSKRYPRYI